MASFSSCLAHSPLCLGRIVLLTDGNGNGAAGFRLMCKSRAPERETDSYSFYNNYTTCTCIPFHHPGKKCILGSSFHVSQGRVSHDCMWIDRHDGGRTFPDSFSSTSEGAFLICDFVCGEGCWACVSNTNCFMGSFHVAIVSRRSARTDERSDKQEVHVINISLSLPEVPESAFHHLGGDERNININISKYSPGGDERRSTS